MSDLRELHYCLRVEFKRNREVLTIIMNQRSYINEVLKCFNMKRCKLVRIMFDTNSKLLKLSDEEFGNVQKKKSERCSIQGWGKFSHVCNIGHEG